MQALGRSQPTHSTARASLSVGQATHCQWERWERDWEREGDWEGGRREEGVPTSSRDLSLRTLGGLEEERREKRLGEPGILGLRGSATGVRLCHALPGCMWNRPSHSEHSDWTQLGQWAETALMPHIVQVSCLMAPLL